MTDWLERTELLLGKDRLARLAAARVLVVGLGGVGACAAEMIARAGVGNMSIVDADTVHATNRNRQLPALVSTEGKPKVEVMAERLRGVNPEIGIDARREFLRDDAMRRLLTEPFDYVVDAIDTLSPKVFLAAIALENGLPLVSSMGSGGRMNPADIEIADISESYNCRLARAMRKRLHRRGVTSGFKVVFSPEDVPVDAVMSLDDDELENQKSIVGSISYMPAIFGCLCASVVIRDLTNP